MTEKQLLAENALLKAKIELYEQPGLMGMYYALNRKNNEFAKMLNSWDIVDLVPAEELELDAPVRKAAGDSFSDKNDKRFERFMTVARSFKQLASDLVWAEKELGLRAKDEPEKKEAEPATVTGIVKKTAGIMEMQAIDRNL